MLNFWATWCGPCRAEIPDLIDLQKRYADKLEIIALATDEDDADEVRRFVLKSGINYRVAMAPDDVRRSYGGIAALPTAFVIDSQGRIVLVNAPAGRHGNMGLNWIEGPANLGLDMNLIKRVKIAETKQFEFRVDALNVLNHPNFSNPNLNINSSSFGRITSATGNRSFVFNLRLNF